MIASIDHCMWFHRDLRADRWLLFDEESPNAYGARGLARGRLMCLACQMEDELWFAYLDQVEREKKSAAAAAEPAKPAPKPEPPSPFTCDEPPSE